MENLSLSLLQNSKEKSLFFHLNAKFVDEEKRKKKIISNHSQDF